MSPRKKKAKPSGKQHRSPKLPPCDTCGKPAPPVYYDNGKAYCEEHYKGYVHKGPAPATCRDCGAPASNYCDEGDFCDRHFLYQVTGKCEVCTAPGTQQDAAKHWWCDIHFQPVRASYVFESVYGKGAICARCKMPAAVKNGATGKYYCTAECWDRDVKGEPAPKRKCSACGKGALERVARKGRTLTCPFCGECDLHVHQDDDESGAAWVECLTCSAEGPIAASKEGALREWNARVLPEMS